MGSPTIKSVRGMNDLLPPESAAWLYYEEHCRSVFARYAYGEIRTPILESTALFKRGIGDETDIVQKEMYTFPDRKDRSMTMRPEMTASCVRSYIQHGIGRQEPVTRWYYIGPMFRYERMQTGRYRQFYQVGVEAFGIAEPSIDAEQIAMAYELYRGLGIEGLDLVVNSVGGSEDRPIYRQVLVDFLTPHRESLCGDCQRRLETNPLRVLDCKVPSCKEIVAGAPSVLDHLTDKSREHFDGVKQSLDALGVPHRIDARLVRGLDYYSGTVFEMIATGGKLGAQSTIVAGGRYNDLVQRLGGPEVPAVGWAAGIERAILSLPGDLSEHAAGPDLYIASRGDAARALALKVAAQLRAAGRRIELEHRVVSLKSQFKRADKLGAAFVVAIGDDEIASGEVVLRNMGTREEVRVSFDALDGELAKRVGG